MKLSKKHLIICGIILLIVVVFFGANQNSFQINEHSSCKAFTDLGEYKTSSIKNDIIRKVLAEKGDSQFTQRALLVRTQEMGATPLGAIYRYCVANPDKPIDSVWNAQP